MYRALEIIRIPTGQFFSDYDRQGNLVRKEWFKVDWREIGPCTSLEDAKKRYGGFPVLEVAR